MEKETPFFVETDYGIFKFAKRYDNLVGAIYEKETKSFREVAYETVSILEKGKRITPPAEIATAPYFYELDKEVERKVKKLEQEIMALQKEWEDLKFKYIPEAELNKLSPEKQEDYRERRGREQKIGIEILVCNMNRNVLAGVITR